MIMTAEDKGTLYLIPSPLGEYEPSKVIPAPTLELLRHIDTYIVEEERTVRRYLSAAGLRGHINELKLVVLNEHSTKAEVEAMLSLFDEGRDVGLISEAGLPAVADPGANLVALCHRHGIKVIPQVGPSSLMMALMASGLNGQRFAFTGYLPAKTEERRNALRTLEKRSAAANESEIIIETPYRNDSFFADILQVCQPQTRVCIAADITTEEEYIMTRTVAEWRRAVPSIGKRPCVFIILGK